MNGRIEREGGIAWRSYQPGQDDTSPRPGMYQSWGEAARKLGSIVGAWICLGWFVSWFARVGEVAGWEIAGLIAGLVVVSAVARRPGR